MGEQLGDLLQLKVKCQLKSSLQKSQWISDQIFTISV